MIVIRGYVCEVCLEGSPGIWLHGQPMSQIHPCWESLASNGLRPFTRLCLARRAVAALRQATGVMEVRLAKVLLEVLEKENELVYAASKKSFIAIMMDKTINALTFFGRRTAEGTGVLPAQDLFTNGLQPFRTLAEALYAHQEIQRQAATTTFLATFHREPIPTFYW